MILTRSRAAWLAALAGTGILVVGVLYARRRGALPIQRARVAMLGAALVLGPLLALTLPNALRWRSDSPYAETLGGIANAQEGSGRGRVLQYRNSLAMARNNPLLGVGPGNWALRYGDVAPPSDPSWVWGDDIPLNPWPSSDWMALVSERGVIALAGALLLGLSLAWRAARQLRLAGEAAMRGATVLAVLLAVAVVGTFDAALLLPVPLLGVAMAIGALSGRPDVTDLVLPAPAPSRVMLVVPLLLGLLALRSTQQTLAYVVAGSGREIGRLIWAARLDPTSYPLRLELAQRLPCARARKHAEAALRLVPEWPASRLAARRCGVR